MIYVYAKTARLIDVSDETVFSDYDSMLERLKESDVVYIKSLGDLGRTYHEIVKHWRTITQIKSAHIVVIDNPVLDTRLGKNVADAILGTLMFADEKNPSSKSKTEVKEAVPKSRQRSPLSVYFDEACCLVANGECNYTEGAWLCYMPIQSFKVAYFKRFDRTKTVEVRQEIYDRLNERRSKMCKPRFMKAKVKEPKDDGDYSNLDWAKEGVPCYHILKGDGKIVSINKAEKRITVKFGTNEQVFQFPKIIKEGILAEAR